MASGDFIMVIPPNWVEIVNPTSMIVAWGEDGIIAAVQENNWGEIDTMIETAGLLPAGQTVGEARLLNVNDGEERLKLWVRYININ